jgi:hypothetical protein
VIETCRSVTLTPFTGDIGLVDEISTKVQLFIHGLRSRMGFYHRGQADCYLLSRGFVSAMVFGALRHHPIGGIVTKLQLVLGTTFCATSRNIVLHNIQCNFCNE